MSDSNTKTSLLVSQQLPAFVREEHETFVKFLEYYYKFLEQDGQQLYVAKNFNRYLDVDLITADILHDNEMNEEHRLREEADYHAFLQKMYDTYIRYIPDAILADKTLILKHAKEFYRSTGSEKSVRFLINALFNKEASFYYPKNDILRASDGKWFIEKSLKVTDVEVDNTANSIAVTNFANTTIHGLSSGATAIVEKVDTYFDKGQIIYELKLSNINKEFQNSERIFTYYTEEGVDHYLTAALFSGTIIATTIINGGQGYIEGTSIPVISALGSGAQIVIDKVSKGSIQAAGVVKTGAGFRVDDPLVIVGSGSGAEGVVATVDNSGFYHPNSYNVVWSTINLEANTAIGNSVYSNLKSIITDPANNWITNSMSYFVYANCGPAFAVNITRGGTDYVPPISIGISANSVISKMGILGKMEIVSGGLNYTVGDTIEFINPVGSTGSGAIANVTSVAANGMITGVKFQQVPGQIIGGSGYDWLTLPTANVVSATGAGANIAVTAIIGQNEELIQSISNVGTIQALTIISGGTGYTDNPTLALNTFGDGTANAVLTVVTGAFSYPGRYVNDDGHLSGYNFLEDRDYYQEFSYVVRVNESTNKYRAALRDLTHPAGAKMFGEYTLTYDEAVSNVANLAVAYANTESRTNAYDTLFQVQGYTEGVLAPNIVIGTANSEFVVGSFKMNTSNHLATFYAHNNSISLYYADHSFVANDYIYLHFETNAWSNLANTNYVVASANVDYIQIVNPLSETSTGNVGLVKVWSPAIMVNMPYSRPLVNDNVELQFKTTDPGLANGVYHVYNVMNVNTFNILHPSMITANDAANVANLITRKIEVQAENHEYRVGDQAYVLFIDGDTANTKNGYYTVTEVGGANSFNISGQNVIFAQSDVHVYQKRSTVTIPGHPHANGNTVYVSFASGDQANTTNGVYTPIKIGADQFTFNVAKPATAECGVRVWYQQNNYSNIVFTLHRDSDGFGQADNVFIEFYSSAIDMANGLYMVENMYNANTFNIHYDANTYIYNVYSSVHNQVLIPGNPNTINAIGYSGLGIVANTRMEGMSLVSVYK